MVGAKALRLASLAVVWRRKGWSSLIIDSSDESVASRVGRRQGSVAHSAKTPCSVLKAAVRVFVETAPKLLASRALSTVRS